jgi:hypothetical protein
MSEAYKRTLDLYWMAKNTADSNTQFNIDSQRVSIQEDYLSCLRLLATYARTHADSVVAWAIWGRMKRLGVKFQGRNVTVGVVKAGDIEVGMTHELKSPFEIQKFLENAMRFTVGNLNEELFERAYHQLKKIEFQKNILIEPEETKKW